MSDVFRHPITPKGQRGVIRCYTFPMAFIGEHEQSGVVASGDIRGLLAEVLEGDFHHFVDGTIGNYFGISRCLQLSIMFWGLMGVLWIEIPSLPLFAAGWLLGTAPIWAPVVALVTAWKAWLWYARGRYLSTREACLLEVTFPRELVRSPRAMDNALSKLWIDSGVTTFLNRVWQGQVTPFFSLEIASFGGSVHFYVWCWRAWRPNIESMLYAYYPEVEIHEVEDYAMKFKFDPDKHECFPTDWRFEPKSDAYPIKTYVDFELQDDPKEEYKIDPLAEVLERMGALRPDEQMWIQIILTMCKDTERVPGKPFWHTQSRYNGLIKREIDNVRKDAAGPINEKGELNPGEEWRRNLRVAQYRHIKLVEDMDRHMSKHPFNVGLRGLYLCDADKFAAPGYTALRWIWRPMGNQQIGNQLRPRRWGNPFDWPWQDYNDTRWRLMQRRFFDAYKRRAYFYSPWVLPHNMMSTETIATIWHPPSTATIAPGLERIPAKKAEPPSNLPK